MADVARLAGVSHQTVSRVLNGHPYVREQTRLRVQAAIDELGYRPNRVARALVTGRSQLIGVVAQNTTLYGPASLLAAFEQAAAEAGFVVTAHRVNVLDRESDHRRPWSGTATSGWRASSSSRRPPRRTTRSTPCRPTCRW